MSCGVGRRRGLDLALLWLWCRPVAVALVGPLAWEPPYTLGVGLKRQKQNKTKQNKKTQPKSHLCPWMYTKLFWMGRYEQGTAYLTVSLTSLFSPLLSLCATFLGYRFISFFLLLYILSYFLSDHSEDLPILL